MLRRQPNVAVRMLRQRVTEEWDLRIINDPKFLSLPDGTLEDDRLGALEHRQPKMWIPLESISGEDIYPPLRFLVPHDSQHGSRDPLEILLRREVRRERRKKAQRERMHKT